MYNRVRNATELLECKLGSGAAADALALAWLHEATGGGKALGVEGGGVASEYSVAPNYKALGDADEVAQMLGGGMEEAVRAGWVVHRPHQSAREVFLDDKGWLSDAPLGEWRGVTCNAAGRVVGLELKDMGLQKPLPRELAALTALESIDLRDNDELATELQPGLKLLDLLDMVGKMHFTDKARTQRFLAHVALDPEAREAVVKQATVRATYGPDGAALRALYDANDLGRLPSGRWFDKEADVSKWLGVACDEAGRIVGLELQVMKEFITALPERLGECAALATLDLDGCSGLTSLPDLSMLPNLEVKYVENASDAAKEWEKGGFKRYPPA